MLRIKIGPANIAFPVAAIATTQTAESNPREMYPGTALGKRLLSWATTSHLEARVLVRPYRAEAPNCAMK